MSVPAGRSCRPRRPNAEGGQALVEFALVLPLFLMVVFGLLDVGRLVYTNSALSQAAREAARLAAAEAAWITVTAPTCARDDELIDISGARPGAHYCPATVAVFRSHVVDAVNRMTVTLGPVSDVHLSCNAGDGLDPEPSGAWTEGAGGNGCEDGLGNPVSASGDLVSVRVEYDYNVFTPIISSIFGAVPLSASASMTIN